MEKLLEVRCCCQPRRLLGWLAAPERPEVGLKVTFAVRPERSLQFAHNPPQRGGGWTVSLPIERFAESRIGVDGSEHRAHGLAFKSEETPVETLRRIPGFIEYERFWEPD